MTEAERAVPLGNAVSLPPLLAGESPIFIVGPGRSGTTLLRSLLSAHSRIAVTPETHFMAGARAWGLERGSPADFDAFWRHYTSGVRFGDLGVDAGRCRELIEMQGASSFEAIFRALLASYGEKVGKPRVGEKTPGHVHFLPRLLDWFPDARVLVAQRDPRAVVASQLQTAYVKRRLTPVSLRHGLVSGKRVQEIASFADDWARLFEQRLPPWRGDPRFRTVVYEALVDDPESELRAICRFLEEDFEPTMLTERTRDAVPMPAATWGDSRMQQWRADHHARSLGRVSSESLGKWRDELAPGEIALIEGRCGRIMQTLGYVPEASPGRRAAGRLARVAIAAAGGAEAQARSLLSKTIRASRRNAR